MIRSMLAKLFAAAAIFLLSGNAAMAQCTAAETYTHNWVTNAWPGSAILSSSYPVNDGGAGGPARNANFTFTGDTGFFANIPGGGGPMTPYSGGYYQGGMGAGTQTLIMGADFMNATRAITLTITLDQPVPDVHFSIFDVDFSNGQFRDFLTITGTNTTTTTNFIPALSREPTSVVFLGPPLTTSEAAGNGSSNTTQSRGNLYVDFTNPINQISIVYQNGNRFPPNNFGLQGIGLHDLTFCPALLPNISVTKSVVVYDPLSLGLHAVPGNEVIYTISVSNTGAVATDLNTLVIEDALPTSMAFYNGDFDDGGPGTTVFNFTPGSSGLTCCGGGTVQFSDSVVPPPVYGYVPAAGYDGNVHYLRIAPTGAMAATSSFQIQFRALLQ